MESISRNQIEDNIKRVNEKIENYAVLFERNPKDITLIGVSKYFPAIFAINAVKSGLIDLGENRVSELIEKQEILSKETLFPNWHFIGTLQRKKVKQLVGNTHLIHSVDSYDLMDEISKRSVDKNIISPVLLQFNISKEDSKHGFDSSEYDAIVERILDFKGIEVKGIMTMAPLTLDELILEDVFSNAFDTFSKMSQQLKNDSFKILSMGMSNDYKFAIKHGATHLRIGTAIFGERHLI